MCQFLNTVAFNMPKMVFQRTAISLARAHFSFSPHRFSRDISPNLIAETAPAKNKSQTKPAKSHKF